MRLLIITDFTESFAYKLLKGIVSYCENQEQWEICRMPPSYKRNLGIRGVVDWAKNWGADAVIGQFDQDDDVSLFAKNGIVVVAQDYIKRFSQIPNITADYYGTGRMAAEHFIEKGFKNYAFFGFRNVCWSDERYEGFKRTVEKAGYAETFHAYRMQDISHLWYYERGKLTDWLLSLPKPVAIMTCDDNQGSNLIDACNSIGIKMPAEVSIIGVDNDEIICNLNTPSLSSIHVDIENGGYKTAALIDRLVSTGQTQGEDIILRPVKVVGRISTASYATSDAEIQKAIKFIHQNLQKKISVKDVMNAVALSRRLLERRFKSVTGESIYQYISRYRVELFADLLQSTNDQVINIALSLGENDSKSISRKFKAAYGMAPNEWREAHRMNENNK